MNSFEIRQHVAKCEGMNYSGFSVPFYWTLHRERTEGIFEIVDPV